MQQQVNEDVIHQELKLNSTVITLTYKRSMTDSKRIHTLLVKPFFEMKDINTFHKYVNSLTQVKINPSDAERNNGLSSGEVAIAINKKLILVPVKKNRIDTVNETQVENTIQGPRFAFTEDLVTNLNLVHNRYQNPRLTMDIRIIGERSKMDVTILYDKNEVNPDVLELVSKRLQEVKEPILETTEKLQNMLNDRRMKLFPIVTITERPDRAVYNIAQGKIVILIDGSPFALIAPAVFWDFMTSMDDFYYPYWTAKFFRTLRYIGLLIGLLLPSLYVGIVSYNPELLKTELALSIAASRLGVPYPSYVEVLFMLLMMELLIESSIRLPKAISATATTVGGLILGQAATEASLVSTIMIIIVSAVVVSNFSIPLNHMSLAIRVMKYVLLLFGIFYGLIGIMTGLFLLILYLASLTSFGEPYFKLHYQKKPNELKEG